MTKLWSSWMRVSKEKAAENRVALLQAASRLFRKRGIDGVGVADIAKEAGLTHGALYAHFGSIDALRRMFAAVAAAAAGLLISTIIKMLGPLMRERFGTPPSAASLLPLRSPHA